MIQGFYDLKNCVGKQFLFLVFYRESGEPIKDIFYAEISEFNPEYIVVKQIGLSVDKDFKEDMFYQDRKLMKGGFKIINDRAFNFFV